MLVIASRLHKPPVVVLLAEASYRVFATKQTSRLLSDSDLNILA